MNSLNCSIPVIALAAGLLMTDVHAQQFASGPAANRTEGALPAATAVGAAQLPGQITPVHTAPADGGHEYGLWAGGDAYKVSFHGDMTFVPYLGSAYPKNQPLSWRTTSATVGGIQLVTGVPVRVHSDLRVEYRYGGITEAYDVRAEGVEQTFVVSRLPAVGDLVITGAVTSDLVTDDVPPAHQALTFRDEQGNPITRYGRAVAFDARGRQLPLTTAFEASEITLRVPGAWLEDAVLPIVVDPLLARVGIASGSDLGEVDIARDDRAPTDNVLFTYVRHASALDGDLYARLTNDDYSGSTTIYTDISTTWDTRSPACAYVGGVDHWVIAMSRLFRLVATPYAGIRCHAHASGDTTLMTNYEILPRLAGHSDWRPDVGGVQSYRNGDEALVVFQTEDNGGGAFVNTGASMVRGVLFAPAQGSDGTFGSPFPIRTSGSRDSERPSVNQVAEGGGSFGWVCALQEYNNSIPGDDWDVMVKRVDNTGTVSFSTWVSDFFPLASHHQLEPIVEGNDGRYAVLFATAELVTTPGKTTSTLGETIHVERFDWAHGTAQPAIAGDKPAVLLATNANRRWQVGGLAFDTDDDSHWVATYRTMLNVGLGRSYYSRLGYNGEATEINHGLFHSQGVQAGAPACVYDNDHDDVLIAYGTDEATNPVYGHTLQYDAVPAAATSGFGCSNATIAWVGNQQIGAEFNYLRVVNGAPVGHFVVVAFAPHDAAVVHPAVAPGCRLLVDAFGPTYLATLPFQFGAQATYPIALPEWLDPMTLYFQDWLFDGNQLESTQRLEVQFVK